MRKSLMVMSMMGVLAMVFMAAMGSYFVGKVGNAEQLGPLRKELAAIYGLHMENRDELTVRVVKGEDGEGIIVAYAPTERLARDPSRCDRQVRRLATHILGLPEWRRLAFVEVHLALPGGATRESRFDRAAFPAIPG